MTAAVSGQGNDSRSALLETPEAKRQRRGLVLGLDTSNYRTSLALVDGEGQILLNRRELLPVAAGERGMRQSDAVYAHLKSIKPMMDDLRRMLRDCELLAACASTRPRDRADSYMPVFEVGDTLGRGIAAAEGAPFFPTDHQHGHLRAAQRGTELEGANRFLALHLSGGTTDLLWRNGDSLEELGSSLDLHAGQLVDRVGVAMGLPFPAGPEMEKLALLGESEGRLGVAMAEGDLSCHLSGAESQAQRWISAGMLSREDIAREVYDLLARTILRMLLAGREKTGCGEALLCGGVASSDLFRRMLAARMERQRAPMKLVYGAPELSGDNAVGVALIGWDRLRMHRI